MAETRLVPLDGAYTVQVAGNLTGLREYRKAPDGTITVPESDARLLLKEGLAFRAAATGPAAHLPGFVCPHCGRRNWIKTCGRCGADNGVREVHDAPKE